MTDPTNQIIEVELPNGDVLKYPAAMPREQIQADAMAKWQKADPLGLNSPKRTPAQVEEWKSQSPSDRLTSATKGPQGPGGMIFGPEHAAVAGAGVVAGAIPETLMATGAAGGQKLKDMGQGFMRGFRNGLQGKGVSPRPVQPRSPSNVVKTGNKNPDDIIEQVLGGTRKGWMDPRGTAMGYGPDSDPEVEALRQFISQLLDKGK
jgi:hypothetical protein